MMLEDRSEGLLRWMLGLGVVQLAYIEIETWRKGSEYYWR